MPHKLFIIVILFFFYYETLILIFWTSYDLFCQKWENVLVDILISVEKLWSRNLTIRFWFLVYIRLKERDYIKISVNIKKSYFEMPRALSKLKVQFQLDSLFLFLCRRRKLTCLDLENWWDTDYMNETCIVFSRAGYIHGSPQNMPGEREKNS